jgi:hypothetical protein
LKRYASCQGFSDFGRERNSFILVNLIGSGLYIS